MNNKRRDRIREVIKKLESCKSELIDIKDEEQQSFDNLPESLQDSDKGETMQDVVDAIDSIDNDMSDIIDSVKELLNL